MQYVVLVTTDCYGNDTAVKVIQNIKYVSITLITTCQLES